MPVARQAGHVSSMPAIHIEAEQFDSQLWQRMRFIDQPFDGKIFRHRSELKRIVISEDAINAVRRVQVAGDLLHLRHGDLLVAGVTHVVTGKKNQVRAAERQSLNDPLVSPAWTLDMQVGQVGDAQPFERGG